MKAVRAAKAARFGQFLTFAAFVLFAIAIGLFSYLYLSKRGILTVGDEAALLPPPLTIEEKYAVLEELSLAMGTTTPLTREERLKALEDLAKSNTATTSVEEKYRILEELP